MELGEQFVMTTLISMLLRLSAECLIKTSEFIFLSHVCLLGGSKRGTLDPDLPWKITSG